MPKVLGSSPSWAMFFSSPGTFGGSVVWDHARADDGNILSLVLYLYLFFRRRYSHLITMFLWR